VLCSDCEHEITYGVGILREVERNTKRKKHTKRTVKNTQRFIVIRSDCEHEIARGGRNLAQCEVDGLRDCALFGVDNIARVNDRFVRVPSG
jgi:hypothetical protein